MPCHVASCLMSCHDMSRCVAPRRVSMSSRRCYCHLQSNAQFVRVGDGAAIVIYSEDAQCVRVGALPLRFAVRARSSRALKMTLLLGFVVPLCSSCVLKTALLLGFAVMACSSRALEMTLLLGFAVWVTLQCRVVSRVASRHVISRRIMSRLIASCRIMSCCVISCRVASRCVMLCHVSPCRVVFCLVASRRVMLVKRAAAALPTNAPLRFT